MLEYRQKAYRSWVRKKHSTWAKLRLAEIDLPFSQYQAPHSWGFLFVGGWVDLDKEFIMKRLLLIIASILFLTTLIFPQSKVNINNLVQYGDKWFKENDDKPYTGRVFDLYKSNGNKKLEGRYKSKTLPVYGLSSSVLYILSPYWTRLLIFALAWG